MYHNIMVPVDGSPFSREAVFQGLRIASKTGATLRLVRVSSPPVLSGGPGLAALDGESHRQARASELADLYWMAAECRAHSTVTVTASLQHGPVLETLIGYAHRTRVDLIVMRSHARKGLARAWFGSIADGLIRSSGIPVIVAKPTSVATAVEGGTSFRRILVPLDGSALAEESLHAVTTIARIDGAQLILLYVVIPAKRGANRGQLMSANGPVTARAEAEAKRYLDSLLTSPPNRSIEIRRRVVISDDIPGAILHASEIEEVDMIAIATRGRGALARTANGSVADRILHDAQVSALVLHPTVLVAEAQLQPMLEGIVI